MKLPRRNFLHLAAGAAALPAVSRIAWAQAYPTRPVRIDRWPSRWRLCRTSSRAWWVQWLSERLGQPFVIENRPGAGSNIGTEAVVRAAAGRLYLLLARPQMPSTRRSTTSSVSISSATSRRSRASAACQTSCVVDPSFPAKTVPEFIAYAKANPGKINMASRRPAARPSWSESCSIAMTDVDLLTVNYRGGGPALLDSWSGPVDVMFIPMAVTIGHIRAGKLRALGVTTTTRTDALPDIPTMGEFVPGYEANGWVGIGAPTNTPAEIIANSRRKSMPHSPIRKSKRGS